MVFRQLAVTAMVTCTVSNALPVAVNVNNWHDMASSKFAQLEPRVAATSFAPHFPDDVRYASLALMDQALVDFDSQTDPELSDESPKDISAVLTPESFTSETMNNIQTARAFSDNFLANLAADETMNVYEAMAHPPQAPHQPRNQLVRTQEPPQPQQEAQEESAAWSPAKVTDTLMPLWKRTPATYFYSPDEGTWLGLDAAQSEALTKTAESS